MKFFSSLYHSLYDVEWLRSRKNKAGWGQFFAVMGITTLVVVIFLAIQVPRGIDEIKNIANKEIPDNFRATLTQGVLNVEGFKQPYTFSEPNQFIFVLNTISTSTLSLQNFLTTAGESGVLIDQNKVEFYNAQNGQSQLQYWKNVPDFSIDKSFILNLPEKITPAMIAIVLIILGAVIFIGFTIASLITILLVTVVCLIVVSIAKKSWNFGELFAVALYAILPTLIISGVFSLLQINIPYIKFLALLAFMLAIIFTKSKTEKDSTSSNDLDTNTKDDNTRAHE